MNTAKLTRLLGELRDEGSNKDELGSHWMLSEAARNLGTMPHQMMLHQMDQLELWMHSLKTSVEEAMQTLRMLQHRANALNDFTPAEEKLIRERLTDTKAGINQAQSALGKMVGSLDKIGRARPPAKAIP